MRRITYVMGNQAFSTLKAEQFMENVVSYFHAEESVENLAAAMSEGGFGSVPILAQDGMVIGIVSEVDLLQAIMEGKDLGKVTADQIMTKNPVTVTAETLALDLIRILYDKHLIRVPVVDVEGHLIGIVARRDILEGYFKATKRVWTF